MNNGEKMILKNIKEKEPGNEEQFRVYDSKGSFVGIYCFEPKMDRYKPVKMFL